MTHKSELVFSFIEALFEACSLCGKIFLCAKTISHISTQHGVDFSNASLPEFPSNSPKIQSSVILHMTLWVPTSLFDREQASELWHQSPKVLLSTTSTSGPHHPPSLNFHSYAMTLNLDPLSIFCPKHKSLLFFLLFGFHGSPWLTPIKSAVSSNKYVVQGDRPACPLTESLHSGITLYSSMHNKHVAVPNPTEAATAHRTHSIAHCARRRPDLFAILPTCVFNLKNEYEQS